MAVKAARSRASGMATVAVEARSMTPCGAMRRNAGFAHDLAITFDQSYQRVCSPPADLGAGQVKARYGRSQGFTRDGVAIECKHCHLVWHRETALMQAGVERSRPLATIEHHSEGLSFGQQWLQMTTKPSGIRLA